MTFPIKKRINAELFIDGKQGLYIQNGNEEKDSDLIEEGNWNKQEWERLRQPDWNDLHSYGRKDKLLAIGNLFEKTELVKWKIYHSTKRRVFEQIPL